jgi:glycosyltransferase involved in cell wall biosynthesis
MQPKFSICFPVYDDFDGLYFSTLNLLLNHSEVINELEIVVVDNHPDSPQGNMTKDWINGYLAANCKARYVAFPGDGGPAQTKQECVNQASGEYILVMDSHVCLAPNAIARLLAYYQENPDTKNLHSGPMCYDAVAAKVGRGEDLVDGFASQMDPVWRGEDYGIWGSNPQAGILSGPPIEVEAMGCGLFTCRKDAFAGFNPNFKGFGGEEFYIYTKTKQAGNKGICLPFLRWIHRFGRPNGVPYPLTRWNKIRNYVIGHLELGLSTDGIYDEFVGKNLMPQSEWDLLIKDPINANPFIDAKPKCGSCGGVPAETTLKQLYEQVANTPSDISEHVPKLVELAAQCDMVVEFGLRTGVSTTAMLYGQPKKLYSYDLHQSGQGAVLKERQGNTDFQFIQADVSAIDIPECDMLFEDSKHTADHIDKILTRHAGKVRRWIAFHDTQIFGERGEDGGPGILPAIRKFLHNNPEWTVIYHSQSNNGFTVLGRLPEDKPQLPSLPRMAWNYAKALTYHTAKGGRMATQETLEQRIDLCTMCDMKTTEERGEKTFQRCSICGCYLDEGPGEREGKLLWAESFCPLGKWEAQQ